MGARVAMVRSKSVGGIEPRLAKEARALARVGHEVHVILWDRDLAYERREEKDGYTIHRIRYPAPYNRPVLAWKLPRWWSKASRLLGGLRPAIVHAVDYDTAPVALRAKRRWGAKFVFDLWDFYADMITASVPGPVRRRVANREAHAARLADLVILPDMGRRTRLPAGLPRVIEVMNVPEMREVHGERRERFHVFYGGNLARDRGLRDLVRACESTGAVLLVAGQGPDEAELVPFIETSPNADFLGLLPHEEVLRETARADAIPILYDPAIPNNRVASPNKLFEAFMCAKPVIVSEGTGMAGLVRSERVGLTVPYGDLAALRGALERLMLSPEECAAMGARGRHLYEARFRWETMEARLVAAYRDLVDG